MIRQLLNIFFFAAILPVGPAFAQSSSPQAQASAKPQSSPQRPNIIYIMADDLGYGDLGCYGQQMIHTPRLDRMAREGLRFTDHYAGHTVCRPSRLSLWTGKHVGHTGLIGNRSRNLSGNEATVARRLQQAGYATGGVGKWALGNVESAADIHNAGHPNNNGFDFWFGYLNQSNAHNYYPTFLWRNRTRVPLAGNVLMQDNPRARGRVSVVRQTYSHDVITDAALDFIRDSHQEPFLLHVHWTIPHANNEAGRVLGNGMEVPDLGRYAQRDWPEAEKGYAAMVEKMDTDVGRMLDLLAELQIDRRTLVLFTSDNGPHNEAGHTYEFFDSNGPLKGYKRSMHDGGIRVPLLAYWPGTIAPGRQSDHPSAAWDFLPTACELAGATPPDDIDGISYVPTLLGRTDQQAAHEYLYWASSEGATAVGMRQGPWKLVQYRSQSKPGRKAKSSKAGKQRPERDARQDWRLYDLDTDLGEETDVSARHPERVAAMLALLERDGLLSPVDTRE